MKRTLLRAAFAAALSLAALMPSVALAETAPAPPAGTAASSAPAPTPAPTPAPSQAPVAATKTVRARVLTDCEHGQANDLVHVPSDVAKEGEKAGVLDTAKGAVEYAASLPQNQKPAG